MRRSSVQGAFRTAKRRAGITKMGVAIHTLRHAFATHLLDAGVNPRLIQRSLGHTQLDTPMLSRHLTHQGPEEAYECLNTLMHGLLPCPPSARSSPPLPQSPWRAIPTSPLRTARSSVPSNGAKAARTDTASISAPAVGDTTASTLPVATATVPHASSIKPTNGSSTTWTNTCPGRTAS
jgi:hypothetical protein